MTPLEIYTKVYTFGGLSETIICDLHSACSFLKGKTYLCVPAGSTKHVIDFDAIKTKADTTKGIGARKSVDALTVSPSKMSLCFLELKSWDLLIKFNGSENNIRNQATKYASDLPMKLSNSIQICEEITNDPKAFNDCNILYILVTDISVEDDGILAFNSDLTALAGISSNLPELCNSLSKGVMDNITSVETRYWECRHLDRNLSFL